ncbi:MAG TPA: cation transporter [Allosphingosinicella sp.]|nr:cation transporter [Allosphingosinicella sp.]
MKLENFPEEIRDDLKRAMRLEYWNIGWTISIIVAMGFAMGSSQTMKTAWVEDTLGLIPPIVFLVAVRFEGKGATKLFPFGFHRVHSFAFLIAAVALAAVGVSLLWDAMSTLAAREHATVGTIHLFGRDLWAGWVMLAAMAYSIVPPLIVGWKEMPLSIRLQDEVIHTDAKMNKANWMTGAAGLFGVLGLGLGWWWADSVAAAIISFDIILDGWMALRVATAELVDGFPRKLGGKGPDPEAEKLIRKLKRQYPGSDVRLRETGRYIHAEICGVEPDRAQDLKALWPGAARRSWRFAQLSFVPPDDSPGVPGEA